MAREKSVSGANPRRVETDARRDARLTAAGCAKKREREREKEDKKIRSQFRPFCVADVTNGSQAGRNRETLFCRQRTRDHGVVGIRAQGCQPINGELIMSLLRGIPEPAVPSIIDGGNRQELRS